MKKLRLTKQNVYKYCYELWSWLAEDPKRRKYDWPGWKIFKNINIEHRCFACEYVKRKKKLEVMDISKFCIECPLSELWGKNNNCESDNSPFNKWLIGSRYGIISQKHPKIRTVYATIIAEYCKNKLEEI